MAGQIHAWAATQQGKALERIEKNIPELSAHEVLLEVQACGICHSDIHLINNDWKYSNYPLVPGHEVLGKVVSLGNQVTHLKKGELVGVGWQRSACLKCEDCISNRDNMCSSSKATCVDHWGGYADLHVTDSRYAFSIPNQKIMPELAPLLCGGATVFSPLCEFLETTDRKPARIGIVGLGGLGHLAVKIASAMGCEITLFSSSERKKAEAEKMGVHHFVSSVSEREITAIEKKLDFILVTSNVDLDWNAYINCLRTDGTLCFVGISPSPIQLPIIELLRKRRKIMGSPIAGRNRMKQMLDFCILHELFADVEIFKMEKVNQALDKVKSNQVHFRGVLVP